MACRSVCVCGTIVDAAIPVCDLEPGRCVLCRDSKGNEGNRFLFTFLYPKKNDHNLYFES